MNKNRNIIIAVSAVLVLLCVGGLLLYKSNVATLNSQISSLQTKLDATTNLIDKSKSQTVSTLDKNNSKDTTDKNNNKDKDSDKNTTDKDKNTNDKNNKPNDDKDTSSKNADSSKVSNTNDNSSVVTIAKEGTHFKYVDYIVKKGDTLFSIAKEHSPNLNVLDVVNNIKVRNEIKDANDIHYGEKISVPQKVK